MSTYVLLTEKHILPYLAEKGPLTEEDVTFVHDKVLEDGYTSKTAHDCANLLMGIIRFAAKKGWWPQPSWRISHEVARAKSNFRLISKEEQRAIMNYIRFSRTPKNIGIYIALTTGISVGELCNLTWQNIDIKARALHVRGIATRYYKIDEEGSGRVWTVNRDTESSNRDIPLSPEQVQFLGEEDGRHLPELFIMSNDTKPSDPRVVRQSFKSLCKKLGIKGVQFKDIRHTFAVRCLEAGCDYGTLAMLMGVNNMLHLVEMYDKYSKKQPRKYMDLMMKSVLEGKE